MILCIGEILADLIDTAQNGVVSRSRFAGGAPFNVACGLKNFGADAGFYGAVGDDETGRYLKGFAESKGFGACVIDLLPGIATTLAVVEHDENNERRFKFCRQNAADSRISFERAAPLIDCADAVHFGSLPLSEYGGYVSVLSMIAYAKQQGKKVSFDVNYREDIFKRKTGVLKEIAALADIVKISEEEFTVFTGASFSMAELSKLRKPGQTLVLTLGKKGGVCAFDGGTVEVGSIAVEAVDTTGAGDAFYAGFLASLFKNGFFKPQTYTRAVGRRIIADALLFGNIAGALTVTKKGAVDALPSYAEVISRMGEGS